MTQPLGPATACWPGDRPFRLEWTMRRDRGDNVDVAAIETSVHTGTHADGPRHVMDGVGAGELPLEPFIGPAIVVDARSFVTGDVPVLEESVLDGIDAKRTPRVLFRTRDDVNPERFPERVVALSQALARRLVAEGFVLVGTDAPSIDPVASETLDAHRVLSGAGIPNVENLVLTHAQPGHYTFIGLPLRLVGADSAPMRAVLIP